MFISYNYKLIFLVFFFINLSYFVNLSSSIESCFLSCSFFFLVFFHSFFLDFSFILPNSFSFLLSTLPKILRLNDTIWFDTIQFYLVHESTYKNGHILLIFYVSTLFIIHIDIYIIIRLLFCS